MVTDPRRAEADRILRRAEQDSEQIGASSLARRTGSAEPGSDNDPAVIWGRRIGRILSVGLAGLLGWTLGLQFGWW